MRIGLFFGTFNPIHIGHLIIGNFVAETTELDQVWFVVSPQSPFKQSFASLNEFDRLHLVELATRDNDKLFPSDIEFGLPRPSYTIDTLAFLEESFPAYKFSLIMGSDNLMTLHQWKNHHLIIERHGLLVYSRTALIQENPYPNHPNVRVLEVPLLDISSSMIRDLIRRGVSARYLLPEQVWQYVDEMNYYK